MITFAIIAMVMGMAGLVFGILGFVFALKANRSGATRADAAENRAGR